MHAIQHTLPKDIISSINQWCSKEIDAFLEQLLLLRAQKKAPNFSNQETELLLKINQGIPFDIQHKYNSLTSKRNNSELTKNEYNELLLLSERIEEIEVQRIKYLSQLAKIRKTTLPQVMIDLGLKEPEIA